jgi:hypothetical protein
MQRQRRVLREHADQFVQRGGTGPGLGHHDGEVAQPQPGIRLQPGHEIVADGHALLAPGGKAPHPQAVVGDGQRDALPVVEDGSLHPGQVRGLPGILIEGVRLVSAQLMAEGHRLGQRTSPGVEQRVVARQALPLLPGGTVDAPHLLEEFAAGAEQVQVNLGLR